MEWESPPVVPFSAAVSPSLAADRDAYELKFLLPAPEAQRVEAWAKTRLTPDPHGPGGTYQTTTLYLDTPHFDIFHKSPGHRRSKYRLRRYGAGDLVHLERKLRRGDRVRKHREALLLARLPHLLDADGAGTWFGPRVRERLLRPVCWISYRRTAYVGSSAAGPLRLTLDRQVVGLPATAWAVPTHVDGRELLPGQAVLEFKFRSVLPGLFREMLATLPPGPGRASKYSRCVTAWDLAREQGQCRTG